VRRGVLLFRDSQPLQFDLGGVKRDMWPLKIEAEGRTLLETRARSTLTVSASNVLTRDFAIDLGQTLDAQDLSSLACILLFV